MDSTSGSGAGIDPFSGGGGSGFLGISPDILRSILPFLSGAAGFFPTPTNTQTTTNQSGTSNLNTLSGLINTLQGTTQQTVSPEIQNLINKATQVSGQQLAGTNLEPYAAQQTENINRTSNLQSQAVQNALAARGLSTSPVAGTAEGQIQAQRVGQITNLQQSLPMLQAQLAQQALSGAQGVASVAPRGTTTSQTQTGQTGTSQTGGFQNQGTSTTQQLAGGGAGPAIGGFTSTLLKLLPFLFP